MGREAGCNSIRQASCILRVYWTLMLDVLQLSDCYKHGPSSVMCIWMYLLRVSIVGSKGANIIQCHKECLRLDDAITTRCGWVAHLRLQRGSGSFEQQTLDLPDRLLDLSKQNELERTCSNRAGNLHATLRSTQPIDAASAGLLDQMALCQTRNRYL